MVDSIQSTMIVVLLIGLATLALYTIRGFARIRRELREIHVTKPLSEEEIAALLESVDDRNRTQHDVNR